MSRMCANISKPRYSAAKPKNAPTAKSMVIARVFIG
nr:MAG TPA: hypothetical protein [Caudoviricetes sp.]DAQ60925.1 MAG TPA: hypothetical protein [Caudoviricetes sp.]